MTPPRRLIVGLTGASGSIYGIRLLERLQDTGVESHLVLSRWGARTLVHETSYTVEQVQRLATVVYPSTDQGAAISSGSFLTLGMVVLPCSMKTLGQIATCTGESLLPRAADVVLKERRRLVLGVRESPLHEIHLQHMLTLTRMGAIIAPPLPAFYIKPRTVDEIVDHTVTRILDLFDIADRRRAALGRRDGRHGSLAMADWLPVTDKFTGRRDRPAPGGRGRGGRRGRRAARRRPFASWSTTPAHRRAAILSQRGRADRRASRAFHRDDRARSRQGVEALGQRGRALRRDVHLCRRGGQAHPRRDRADGRVGLRREPHRLLPARAAGRRVGDHAVQLPAQPGRAQGGAGAGRRQHRRAQAGRGDAAHRRADGRLPARRRLARRRAGTGARRRAGHRRGAGAASAAGQGLVHRQPAGGHAHPAACRAQARHAGTRQQLGHHRRARREPGRGRAALRDVGLRQCRSGVHQPAAALRPRGDRRRIHGAVPSPRRAP